MTVLSTSSDPGALTTTMVADLADLADLAAPSERVWQVWADARQLERWWGPPTWPATFEQLELVPGGRARYVMIGPQGEKARGWWLFLEVDEPLALDVEDGFADESGEPDVDLPVTRAEVRLEPVDAGTRMTITSRFASREQMEQVLAMGAVEGMTQAMGQIDAILTGG